VGVAPGRRLPRRWLPLVVCSTTSRGDCAVDRPACAALVGSGRPPPADRLLPEATRAASVGQMSGRAQELPAQPSPLPSPQPTSLSRARWGKRPSGRDPVDAGLVLTQPPAPRSVAPLRLLGTLPGRRCRPARPPMAPLPSRATPLTTPLRLPPLLPPPPPPPSPPPLPPTPPPERRRRGGDGATAAPPPGMARRWPWSRQRRRCRRLLPQLGRRGRATLASLSSWRGGSRGVVRQRLGGQAAAVVGRKSCTLPQSVAVSAGCRAPVVLYQRRSRSGGNGGLG